MSAGPNPAQTRVIIQDLIDALAKISAGPRRGGPASIVPARAIAREALLVMPMRYMPRDGEWEPATVQAAEATLAHVRSALAALDGHTCHEGCTDAEHLAMHRAVVVEVRAALEGAS